jgi:hypothetical protein
MSDLIDECDKLSNIYLFDGAFEGHRKNLAHGWMFYLVVGAARTRRRAFHAKLATNRLDIADLPIGSRVPPHSVEAVAHP